VQYLYEGEYNPLLEDSLKHSSEWIWHKQTVPHSCNNDEVFDVDDCSCQVCDHHNCSRDCSYKCVNFECDICIPKGFLGGPDQLLTHSKMYEIGERYAVPGLKALAKEKFRVASGEFWKSSVFPQAAYHVFSSTITDDEGLRSVVSETLASHMELVKSEEIAALMMEFNGLAYGLLREKVKRGWK